VRNPNLSVILVGDTMWRKKSATNRVYTFKCLVVEKTSVTESSQIPHC